MPVELEPVYSEIDTKKLLRPLAIVLPSGNIQIMQGILNDNGGQRANLAAERNSPIGSFAMNPEPNTQTEGEI